MIIGICLSLLLSCNYHEVKDGSIDKNESIAQQTDSLKNVVIEDKEDLVLEGFMNRISKFKKVAVKQSELGDNKLQYFLRDTMSEPEKYYWVQVGYDNGIRMIVVYNFFCYPKTNKIYYLNTETEKTILVNDGDW